MHDPATAFRARVLVGILDIPRVSQARAPKGWAGHVGIQRGISSGPPERLNTCKARRGKRKMRSTFPAPDNPAGVVPTRRVMQREYSRESLSARRLFAPERSLDYPARIRFPKLLGRITLARARVLRERYVGGGGVAGDRGPDRIAGGGERRGSGGRGRQPTRRHHRGPASGVRVMKHGRVYKDARLRAWPCAGALGW